MLSASHSDCEVRLRKESADTPNDFGYHFIRFMFTHLSFVSTYLPTWTYQSYTNRSFLVQSAPCVRCLWCEGSLSGGEVGLKAVKDGLIGKVMGTAPQAVDYVYSTD